MSKQNKWTLTIGIHRGTTMSRDVGIHTTKYDSDEALLTLHDVQNCANSWAANYADSGYQIWFTSAKSSTGEEVKDILTSDPYK